MKRIAAILFSLAAAVTTVTAAPDEQTLKLIQLSVTARSTGNLLLEQLLLRRIMIESSGDIAEAASHRLARSSVAFGDPAEAIRILTTGDAKERSRDDQALLGEAYRLSGDSQQATQILAGLLNATPNISQPDDAAIDAVESLDAIGGVLDDAEHLRRGGIYQFNRQWAQSRGHYEHVKTGDNAAEAMFQIGRGYSFSLDFATAGQWYQRVIDQFPDSQQAKDALLQSAAACARQSRFDEAVRRYQTFIDKYSTDEKLDRAYLNIVDTYRDAGDDAKALEWCQKTEAAFAGKTPEALAIFDEAKVYLARNESDNARSKLEQLKGRNDLGGATVPGGTTREEVISMIGRAFQGQTQPERSTAPVVPTPKPSDFPAAFREIVLRRTAPLGVDPRLILAIMRTESRFDPQARSAAAARGLMQLTHPTAVRLARELGWTRFDDEELYSPENSIALAVKYIADLQAMFPNQPEAVVASYNGGEDNVKRWIARSRSNDPQRYVPEFVYAQTKEYVYRVMADYRVYQQLYDEQLKPK